MTSGAHLPPAPWPRTLPHAEERTQWLRATLTLLPLITFRLQGDGARRLPQEAIVQDPAQELGYRRAVCAGHIDLCALPQYRCCDRCSRPCSAHKVHASAALVRRCSLLCFQTLKLELRCTMPQPIGQVLVRVILVKVMTTLPKLGKTRPAICAVCHCLLRLQHELHTRNTEMQKLLCSKETRVRYWSRMPTMTARTRGEMVHHRRSIPWIVLPTK